jgi:hypothetical protein
VVFRFEDLFSAGKLRLVSRTQVPMINSRSCYSLVSRLHFIASSRFKMADCLRRNAGPWDGFSTWFSYDSRQSKGMHPIYSAHVERCGSDHPVTGQPLAQDSSSALLGYQACSNNDAEGHDFIFESITQALPVAVLWNIIEVKPLVSGDICSPLLSSQQEL